MQVGGILGIGQTNLQPPQNVEQPPAKVRPAQPAPRPNQEQLPPNKPDGGDRPSSGSDGCLDAQYSGTQAMLVDCGDPFGGLFGGGGSGGDDIVPDAAQWYPWNPLCDSGSSTLVV